MRRVALALGIVTSAVVALGMAARPDPVRAREIARIRAHFDSVLVELHGRDVTALTAPQRRQRQRLLATLRAYRDAGDFPHNYDFPGQAVPYFVDRETGALCAVANLIASTGRGDIVERVTRANNNVLVPALAGDTAFRAWLDTHGLTLAEAARIQVPYIGIPPGDPAPVREPVASRRIASTAAIGMASLGALYFSTRSYLRHRESLALTRAARESDQAHRVSLAPTITPATGSAGVTLNLRF
jgi:hypothetical protein